MSAKKNEYRFTIVMNPDDPAQKKAADFLNGLGRMKSYHVARALISYMGAEKNDQADPTDTDSGDIHRRTAAMPVRPRMAVESSNAVTDTPDAIKAENTPLERATEPVTGPEQTGSARPMRTAEERRRIMLENLAAFGVEEYGDNIDEEEEKL